MPDVEKWHVTKGTKDPNISEDFRFIIVCDILWPYRQVQLVLKVEATVARISLALQLIFNVAGS